MRISIKKINTIKILDSKPHSAFSLMKYEPKNGGMQGSTKTNKSRKKLITKVIIVDMVIIHPIHRPLEFGTPANKPSHQIQVLKILKNSFRAFKKYVNFLRWVRCKNVSKIVVSKLIFINCLISWGRAVNKIVLF